MVDVHTQPGLGKCTFSCSETAAHLEAGRRQEYGNSDSKIGYVIIAMWQKCMCEGEKQCTYI